MPAHWGDARSGLALDQPRRLRVAITLEQCWHRVPGGTATSMLSLSAALARRADVELVAVAARHRAAPPSAFRPTVPIRQLPLPRLALYESWHLVRRPPVQAATGPVDVVHATTLAIPPRSAPLVVTVHDLAPLADASMFTGRGVRLFRRGLDLVRREADLVLVPSTVVAAECALAGIAADRVRVVPHGVSVPALASQRVAQFRSVHGLERPYLLWVGTLEPRKNLAGLLAAYGRLAADGLEVDLALVGPHGWGVDLESLVPSAVRTRLHRLGFLHGDDLHAAYLGAAAFCYPSLREGFGLPALEAMAHGVPTVTSAGTSMAEYADGAALLADPRDHAALATAIGVALTDTAVAARLRVAGPQRASAYTWERAAQTTAAAYHDAVAAGRGRPPRRPSRSVGRSWAGVDRPLLHVGVNLLWLVPGVVGGTETYAAALLRALAGRDDVRVTLFALPQFAAAHPDLAAAHRLVVAPLAPGRHVVRRVGLEVGWLPGALRQADVGVVHHLGGIVPPRMPGPRAPAVLTVHDLQVLDFPAYFSAAKRLWLTMMLGRSVRSAAVVMAPSNFTRDRVVDRYRISIDRTAVVTAPVLTAAAGTPGPVLRKQYRLDAKRLLLYPAAPYPHKNHLVLLDALARVVRDHPDVTLLLTGTTGAGAWGSAASTGAAVRERAARSDLAGHVIDLGFVPRTDLDGLYAETVAVVFPSRYEGYGYGVAEAMAAGCPVVAADATALPEVVGRGPEAGGLLVGPDDVARWAAAIGRLLTDAPLRARLATAARHRAANVLAADPAPALLGAYRAAACLHRRAA